MFIRSEAYRKGVFISEMIEKWRTYFNTAFDVAPTWPGRTQSERTTPRPLSGPRRVPSAPNEGGLVDICSKANADSSRRTLRKVSECTKHVSTRQMTPSILKSKETMIARAHLERPKQFARSCRVPQMALHSLSLPTAPARGQLEQAPGEKQDSSLSHHQPFIFEYLNLFLFKTPCPPA